MPGFDAIGTLALGQVQRSGTAYALQLAAGAYVLSGKAVGLNATIALAAGAYVLSGQTMNLAATIKLNAGSYTLAGKPVTYANNMSLGVGEYILGGEVINLRSSHSRRALYIRGSSYWRGQG